VHEARRNPLLVVVVLTPLVIAPVLLLSVYLGFYLGNLWGYSKALLALVFSAIGLAAGFAIIIGVITRLVGTDQPTT
jgi:NADH:ubiquinone oxidoreductase subunit K